MISATVNLIISAILLIGVVVLYILVLTGKDNNPKDNNPTFDTISVKNIKLGAGLGITTGKSSKEIQFYGKRNGQDQVAALIKVENNPNAQGIPADWGTIFNGNGVFAEDVALSSAKGCNTGSFC